MTLLVDLGGIETRISGVRDLTERAQRDAREAAAQSRALVRDLRGRGVSVSDTATLLGVTRGRVSQLVKRSARAG